MVTMRMKMLFFDHPKVKRAVDRARRNALTKGGAFIRRTAKESIRKRKGPAPPDSPPHSHQGQLRKLIFFGYDARADSVVIGPLPFRQGTAPNLLEFGGATTTRKARAFRDNRPGQAAKGKGSRGKLVRLPAGTRLNVDARPFMGPALEKERSNLPKVWANSVRE